jgi:transposase
MVIILDNSRYHHARSLQSWLWEHRKVLRLDFLPPYSPQLNPIERVWKLTRKLCVHNRYFPTLQDLIFTIEQQYKLWVKPNHTLHRLCAII